MEHEESDLEKIIYSPQSFPCGKVITIHRIGRYAVVEYRSKRKDEQAAPYFHPYVDGKDTCHSFRSLEASLVFSFGYDRVESSLAYAAMKLLDLE